MRRRLNLSARGWSAGAGILIFLFAGFFAGRALAQGRDVLVFAAASLRNALDDVNAEYQRQSGHKVVVSYAASPTLARQIEAAAPADVFLSADLDWMDYLAKRRLIKGETRRNLLGNRLVLVGGPLRLPPNPPDTFPALRRQRNTVSPMPLAQRGEGRGDEELAGSRFRRGPVFRNSAFLRPLAALSRRRSGSDFGLSPRCRAVAAGRISIVPAATASPSTTVAAAPA